MMNINRVKRVLLLCALAMTPCQGQQNLRQPGAAENWPNVGGGADESAFSRLDNINTSNIGELGLAWYLDLPGEVTLEAPPLAISGRLYFSGTYSTVYAVDGTSGKLLWKYDPETWKHHPERMRMQFAANRGVAYAKGRVFVTSFDGRLVALDAKSGQTLWSTETLPASGSTYYCTGAPRVFGGKVIIGNAGSDFGSRGYVTAYDQTTGAKVWRFYTMPGAPEQNKGDPAMERAASTWTGEFWKTGGGGGVWNGITFDSELNRIYLGTANASPYDATVRSPGGGDNLYTASIVALDADTGKYVWHYQVVPRDSWDYDNTQQMTLADIVVDGKPRKVLMQAPKSGFFYVIDRETGKLISAEKIGKVTWADRVDLQSGRPVERKNIRYELTEFSLWPAPLGTHNWQAMSYSPHTGLVYIPFMQLGVHYRKGMARPGEISIGGVNLSWAKEDSEDVTASLLAWDPAHQKQAWKVRLNSFWNGGTLATAGDLVFQGTGDGFLSAYDARSGARLWRFDAALGILAAPVSYSLNGRQYVAVLVGYGGTPASSSDIMNAGWKYGAQPRRLLSFAIGGQQALPATPPSDLSVNPVDDPAIQISESDVEAGYQLFPRCGFCHGKDAVSAGMAPDLRESAIALHLDSLRTIVSEGALLQKGMPRFEDMTEDQLRKIHAYIRARARETLAQQSHTRND
jgi:quinohemoprotein ethanol dehydrogenase